MISKKIKHKECYDVSWGKHNYKAALMSALVQIRNTKCPEEGQTTSLVAFLGECQAG